MDFSYLISISEGDKRFTDQFISTFDTNTKRLLKNMENALESNDLESLRKFVHQLKPSLEMLRLKSHSIALKIHENPAIAKPEDIRKIEEECELAVKKMNERFS